MNDNWFDEYVFEVVVPRSRLSQAQRDALDGEGPRPHGAAEPRGVRQHPAADAGVDVNRHTRGGRPGSDLADRIEDGSFGLGRHRITPPWAGSAAA